MTVSLEMLEPVSPDLPSVTSRRTLPPSVLEQFRLLARRLEAKRRAGGPKAFVVTSPQAREGRTFTALACARALAGRGLRVALVDLDLRHPQLAEMQGLMPLPGIVEYITGGATIEDTLQVVPGVPSMVFVSAGEAQSDPSSFFFEPRMRHILDNLRSTFDVVVCDGPPALGIADAPCIADLVGGALLVARAGHTSRRDLQATAAEFEGVPILGCVLLGADRFASTTTESMTLDELPRRRLIPALPAAATPATAVAP